MADEGAARPDPGTWSLGGAAGRDDPVGETAATNGWPTDPVGPADSGGSTPGNGAAVNALHPCPWCSVDLGQVTPERCPSCGAALVADPEASVPGVTAVDPEAVRRAATWERVRKRASLRGFLLADPDEAADSGVRPSSLEALDPPSAELRQEMGRLRAELQAAAEGEAGDLVALEAASDGAGAVARQVSGSGASPAAEAEAGGT